MADVSATYAVQLTDETSGAANKAAGSLENLRAKIEADQAALRNMQTSMRQLQGGSNVSIEQFKSLSTQIKAQKESIAQATSKYVSLGGTFEKVAKPAQQAGVSLDKIAAGIGGANQQLGPMAGRLKAVVDLVGQAGMAGAVGIAAIAVAALTIGIAAGLIAGLVSMAKQALSAGDAVRDMSVDLEAAAIAAKNFKASGNAMSAVVLDVASQVPIARDQVAGFAKQLAGIKGDNFEKALKAVSTLGSVGGNTGKLVASLNAAAKSGRDISTITSKIQAQYGDLAKAKMLDVNTQFAKAKENIAALFAGVKIEGFEKALQGVLSLFSQSTVSGRALKTLVESLLNPLFGGAAKAGPALTSLFKQGVIYALKFEIAIYQVRNKLAALMGVKKSEVLTTLFQKAEPVIKLVAVALGGVLFAVVALMAIFGALAGAVLVANGAFLVLVAKAAAFGAGIVGAIGKAVSGVVGYVGQFLSAGKNMVLGIAKGITSGASSVVSAALGVAKGAVTAVKGALGIHSPSKVFAEVGVFASKGMAEGIDTGSAHVEDAAKSMVSIPSVTAQKSTGGGAAAGGRGGLTIGNITVNVTGNGQGVDIAAIKAAAKQAVEEAFEATANMMAAPLEAP